MRVKCIANDVGRLDDVVVRKRLALSIHLDGADEDLVIGSTYFVFALARWNDGGIWIYLNTVDESEHPYPYPLEMFDVIDSALSANWCVNFEQLSSGKALKRISFPEWANDDCFYEKLVDGDKTAMAIYELEKKSKGPGSH